MRRVTILWPAGPNPRRSHINEFRPELYHPELHIVEFAGTVEAEADSAPARRVTESRPLTTPTHQRAMHRQTKAGRVEADALDENLAGGDAAVGKQNGQGGHVSPRRRVYPGKRSTETP